MDYDLFGETLPELFADAASNGSDTIKVAAIKEMRQLLLETDDEIARASGSLLEVDVISRPGDTDGWNGYPTLREFWTAFANYLEASIGT